jgi:hypothetical protein
VGDLLGWDGVCYDSGKVDGFWRELQDWLRRELSDPYPIRLFIKVEPHAKKKVEAKRWRLISSFSLREQVLDHMLFDAQNDLEIENWHKLPFKAGMSLGGGGYRLFRDGAEWVASDKSAWDWTVPGWVIEADFSFRCLMCVNSYVEDDGYKRWKHLAQIRYRQTYGMGAESGEGPILQLSDGRRFRQLQPGLVKSGSVNTIATNSHAQVLLHEIAWRRAGLTAETDIWALGDDTVTRVPKGVSHQQILGEGGYLEHTGRLGCKIKFGEISRDPDFAGHRLLETGPVPLYSSKHFFKIPFSREVLEDVLDSYQRLYAKDPPRLRAIRRWTQRLAPTRLLSDMALQCWYEGWESLLPALKSSGAGLNAGSWTGVE